jgi:hypothetical protein
VQHAARYFVELMGEVRPRLIRVAREPPRPYFCTNYLGKLRVRIFVAKVGLEPRFVLGTASRALRIV